MPPIDDRAGDILQANAIVAGVDNLVVKIRLPDLKKVLQDLLAPEGEHTAGANIHVRYPPSNLEILNPDDLKSLLLSLRLDGSRSIVQRDPTSSAADGNSVLSSLLQGYATLQAHKKIDGHEPQVVIFKLPYRPNKEEHGDEIVLGRNPRKVSSDADVQDDGPHSGIVRVMATFLDRNGVRWLGRGSGTLIDARHVMTVGHNVWDRKLGPAVSITIRRDRRADPHGMDDRPVEMAGVQYNWATEFSKQNDFAILHVSDPFPCKMQPMRYQRTPTEVDPADIKIYGYPRDMPKDENGVWLAQLSFSQSRVRYVPGGDNLLSHDGDTTKGTSGGPIVDSGNTAIAIHRGYGRVATSVDVIDINKAVVINHHGNDVEKFIEALAFYSRNPPGGDFRTVRSATFMFRGSEITFLALN
ncbi:trypsin-like serine protease [Xylariaceae sp. AK1471]|nr:trypsin-like serine protease [Xylariaceae sp. AK1471]